MTRDNIIRMAQEAGGAIYEVDWCFEIENLERFAFLIAAAEREACARRARRCVKKLKTITTKEKVCVTPNSELTHRLAQANAHTESAHEVNHDVLDSSTEAGGPDETQTREHKTLPILLRTSRTCHF